MSDLVAILSADSSQLQKSLNDAKTVLTKYKNEANHTTDITNQQVEAFNKSVNSLNKLTNSAKTNAQQMGGLRKQLIDLSTQYKSLNDTARNSDFGKALAATIKETEARYKELQKTVNDVNSTLGINKDKTDDCKGVLDGLSSIVGVNIGSMAKLGSIVGAGSLAFDELKQAVFLNETAIDEWGRTIKGAEAAHNTFLHALNSGNWSNFFSNLQEAIRGARQLYDEFDALGSIKANNKAAIALVDAELAQLRKLKKEGKDVQKQIDDATKRKAILVNEGVTAGKTANRDAIVKTLKQYNPKMSDSAAEKTADNLLKNGQKAFKSAEKTIKSIEKYARDHYGKMTKTEYIDGQTQDRNLTKAEMMAMLPSNLQGAYRNAMALKQSETKVEVYVSGYADAVAEGTQNTNADLKFTPKSGGNGGSGKGGGGVGSTTSNTPKISPIDAAINRYEDAIKSIQSLLGDGIISQSDYDLTELKETDKLILSIKSNWKDATDTQKEYFNKVIGSKNEKLSKAIEDVKNIHVSPIKLDADIQIKEVQLPKVDTQIDTIEEYDNAIKQLSDDLAKLVIGSAEYQNVLDKISVLERNKAKDIEKAKGTTEGLSEKTKGAADAVGQLGSAFSSIGSAVELPELNFVGVMAQAIANMVLSYSQALSQASALGPWAWVGFGATGLAELAAIISTVKSIGTYADGGIIQGATSLGDFNVARVNNGEMILNGSQQKRLFAILNGSGGFGNSSGKETEVHFKIKGKDLIGSQRNYYKRQSRL